MNIYLIGIKGNRHFCGNTGTVVLSGMQTPKRIRQAAQNFQRMYAHDEVYLINTYSQSMCEMDGDRFVNFVRKNGMKM